MRKFLSLFAAVLVALVANAAVINITNANADALRLALNSAQTGSIIEMAAGTYVESNSDYIAFAGKEVTVRAAEGAEVIIQPKVSVTLSEGAKARFENIKFDVSHLTDLASWYEHLIYPTDATENRLELEGCEFYGFNLNKSMIYCSSSNKLSAITVNNCYFHDCMKSLIFVESTADMNAQIKNSTFANISTNTESYWAGVIDIRATGATLLVDHCTFYNVIPMNTDYSCVSKVTLANGVASNCIFMLPTAQDGIRAMRGVTANNCITFNYLKDSGTGIHSSVTKNNCVQVDPLFVDAANGNFTLGEGSPALTMNDGQPIGDPRWIPSAEPVEPNVKTIYCKVAQDWWKTDGAAVGAYAWKGETANAAWPGARMAAVEGEADLWKIDLDVNAYESIIFTRVNGTGDIADWGAKTADLTIPTDDKDLYTITSTDAVWGDPGVTGEWSKYVASEPVTPILENGFYLIGKINGVEGWDVASLSAERKFAGNPDNPAEFVLTATLAEGDAIKVVNVVNDVITAWYPDGMDNEYVVDAAHAGENKDIYFQPDYKEDWAAFGGYFWTGAKEEPAVDFTKPFTLKFNGNGSSDNSNSFTVESGVAAIFDEASAPYVSELNTVSNVYSARTIADDPSSLKFGTSSKKGTLAFTIGQAIEVDSIIVNATQYGNNAAEVTVNGTKFDLTQGNKVPTDCKITPEGEVSTITIAQTGSERIYVRYVAIYPKSGTPIVEPRLADGFYLNGSHVADWAVENLTAELKFEPTEENPAEYKLTTTLTEGQEIKVVKVEADAIVAWYPAEGGNYVVDAAHAGENKDIYFQETYKEDWAAFGGHIWTGANEEPQPTKYCELATGHLSNAEFGDVNGRILLTIQKIADSNNLRVAIKNNTAAGNTKAGLNYLWVNATGAKNNNATYGSHEAEDVEEVSVIVEFDEAQESYVFNNIHWAYAGWGGEWAIDGLTVSAAELCEASTPIVEVTYYMKNNWDAGADWTWKAMTKDGETYKLEKVVFGGTGVNYNTAESDEGSSWVPVANIAGDAISAKDTVTLVLDPAAGTVTATLIGKYVDPNPGEHTYTVAGSSDVAFGTAWDPTNAHNDMVLNGVGIYLWEKTELTLPEGTIKFKVCEDHAWDVAYPAQDYELAISETGVYTIYIAFNPDTKEVTANATKTGDATVTVDYYLVGSAKGWEAKAENIFTLNAEAGEGIEEYKIETTLEVGEGLKVLSSTGVWYPDGMGNEYVVDQDHAGATTIYFRPAGNAEWEAFGGFMYVVPTGGAGIDAVDANAPAVKVLHNGQILIKKGDKTYNVMGAIVR